MSGDQAMSHCGWACVFYSVYGYRYMIVTSIPPSLDVVSMSSFVGIFILLGVFLKKIDESDVLRSFKNLSLDSMCSVPGF